MRIIVPPRLLQYSSFLAGTLFGGWYMKSYQSSDQKSKECSQSAILDNSERDCQRVVPFPWNMQEAISKCLPAVEAAKGSSGPAVPSEPPQDASRVSHITRFGFPRLDCLIAKQDYVIAYDRRNKIPHWVLEHMTKDRLQHNDSIDRAHSTFFEDDIIHPYFRATNKDYERSGYDRGHLAAASNHRLSQQHCDETFSLANIAPQVGKGFNRDYWNKLEKYVRYQAKSYRNTYVCTGPLFLPRQGHDNRWYVTYEVIGPNHVAVPTHFFKVIVMEDHNLHLDLEVFVIPNAPIDCKIPLSNFHANITDVEKKAGVIFFEKLSHFKFRNINKASCNFQ